MEHKIRRKEKVLSNESQWHSILFGSQHSSDSNHLSHSTEVIQGWKNMRVIATYIYVQKNISKTFKNEYGKITKQHELINIHELSCYV